jgi:hypothetical protein
MGIIAVTGCRSDSPVSKMYNRNVLLLTLFDVTGEKLSCPFAKQNENTRVIWNRVWMLDTTCKLSSVYFNVA